MNIKDLICEKIVETLVDLKLNESYDGHDSERKGHLRKVSKGRSANTRPSTLSDESNDGPFYNGEYITQGEPKPPVAGKRAGTKWYGKRVERMLALKAKRGQTVDDSDE